MYEPEILGMSKRLDYLLDCNNQKCFFDVKELRKKKNEPTTQSAFIDPYTSLRKKINEATRQFKEYKKEYCCSLVVFNVSDGQAILAPLFVLSAMLGNLGFSTKFNTAEGKAIKDSEKNVFLNGGKMINYGMRTSQNTTISSIIVLENNFLNDTEYQRAIKEEIKKQNRPLKGIEQFKIAEIEGHHSTSVTRVVVVENPFAKIVFPEDLFVGPFDEHWRWATKNGKIERVFAGERLKELETLKQEIYRNTDG